MSGAGRVCGLECGCPQPHQVHRRSGSSRRYPGSAYGYSQCTGGIPATVIGTDAMASPSKQPR
jgi:hypothetical protein